MRVAVTGSRGFVGRVVVSCLRVQGHSVLALSHSRDSARTPAAGPDQPERVETADGVQRAQANADTSPEQLRELLQGCESVIHLAAKVHCMDGGVSEQQYTRVNTGYTRTLALAAQAAGVRRFVFMSSVKVNGERTQPGKPFDESSPAAPQGHYAQSKWDAERALSRFSSNLEVAIVRSPLVYGPGVGANFLALWRAVTRGWPLPFGQVRNRRSLVYVENLADALVHLAAAERPLAGASAQALKRSSGECERLFVRDGEDLSTPELVRRIAAAWGRPARLLPVPVGMLRTGLALAGRATLGHRLLDSLQVSSQRLRDAHGWSPPRSVDSGLRATAQWLRSRAC